MDAHPRVIQGLWPASRAWNKETKNLCSEWIESFFDAPIGERLSFVALHDALRDDMRNFLYDHLGGGDDAAGAKAPVIDSYCADRPLALRGYFSFNLERPFAYSSCTSGGGWHATNLVSTPFVPKSASNAASS